MDSKTEALLINRAKEGYEAQLFGFSSSVLASGVNEMVSEHIQIATEALYKCIAKYTNESKLPKLQAATDCLKQEYETAAAESQLIWKRLIEEYFTIPDNVLLPEDKVQSIQYTTEDVEKLDRELKELERRCKRVLLMKSCIEKEMTVLKEAETAHSQFSALQKELKPILINDDKLPRMVKRLMNLTFDTVVSESKIVNTQKRKPTDYIDHVLKKKFKFSSELIQEEIS